jgi:hypothetical protein
MRPQAEVRLENQAVAVESDGSRPQDQKAVHSDGDHRDGSGQRPEVDLVSQGDRSE